MRIWGVVKKRTYIVHSSCWNINARRNQAVSKHTLPISSRFFLRQPWDRTTFLHSSSAARSRFQWGSFIRDSIVDEVAFSSKTSQRCFETRFVLCKRENIKKAAATLLPALLPAATDRSDWEHMPRGEWPAEFLARIYVCRLRVILIFVGTLQTSGINLIWKITDCFSSLIYEQDKKSRSNNSAVTRT